MTITVPAISTAANGMTFLAAVNRMLRIQGFIRGDTDPLTSFSDTSHNSTSQLAQIAIQQELTELQSRQLIPAMHKITGVITLATNVRSYALPADFIQFWGDPPLFYDASANYQVGPYPGGENRLRQEIMDYRTAPGYPLWFYNELSVARQISFYPVPDAPRDGLVLTYDYGASVQVTYSTDTLPFQNDQQSQAFVDCAVRRFKIMYEGQLDADIEQDPTYKAARTRLFALIKNKQPSGWYGKNYVSAAGLMRF